jgi:hypothetical protein
VPSKPLSEEPNDAAQRNRGRKPYSSPRLTKLGYIRDLTLGGSPGTGDSGGSDNFNPPHP